MTRPFFAPTSKTKEGQLYKTKMYEEIVKEESLMNYWGRLSWEAIEQMTPFERKHYNKTVEESLKNNPAPPPQPM